MARDGLEPRSVAVGGKPRLLRSAGSMELYAGAHVLPRPLQKVRWFLYWKRPHRASRGSTCPPEAGRAPARGAVSGKDNRVNPGTPGRKQDSPHQHTAFRCTHTRSTHVVCTHTKQRKHLKTSINAPGVDPR